MYPNKMALIYQATRNFQRYHLKTCPHMPPAVISDFGGMKRKHAANNSQKYWITSAEAKGLIDVVNPSMKKGSGKRDAAKISSSESGIEFRQGFNWTPLCSKVLSVQKKNPHHHTDAADPPRNTSGRKRSFYEHDADDGGDGLQMGDQGGGGDVSSSLPPEQVLAGDALDIFLHFLDETYKVIPNDSSNHHQSAHSATNVDPQNDNGTSTSYAAASAASSTDFEPIPLSFLNEVASIGHSPSVTNILTNQQQPNQFSETQWDNQWAGDQTYPGVLPSGAGASPLHSPISPSSQQQQSLQFHQQRGGEATASKSSQSEALLAAAVDNIAWQRQLIKELSRH